MQLKRICLGLAATLALSTVISMPAQTEQPRLILAKVGLELLTQDQHKDLQERMALFAWSEALLKRCAMSTNIEQRMREAVTDCVKPAALEKVTTQFRALLEQAAKKEEKGLPCEHKMTREALPKLKQFIDNAISEATKLCRACLFC